MIIVIADDITGAAEMAGIALRYGLKTMLSTAVSAISAPSFEEECRGVDVLVIATDIRSGNAANARSIIRQIVSSLSLAPEDILYKKTDSVMRGHIAVELGELMEAMNYSSSLLLAQNPSKGRVVKEGVYYVGDNLLGDTDFRFDPEFPATSSNVVELLSNDAEVSLSSLSLDGLLMRDKTINVADAENAEEIMAQLSKTDKTTLLAGGADLFTVLLQIEGREEPLSSSVAASATQPSPKLQPTPSKALVFTGSTQSKSIMGEQYVKGMCARECEIPMDVFLGGDAAAWFREVSCEYDTHTAVVVSIGRKENGGPDCAVRLRTLMADLASRLVAARQPDLLIIEGGATAFAILNAIGWDTFLLKTEYAPGVVSMTHGVTEIILKPGSYPWGNLFSM